MRYRKPVPINLELVVRAELAGDDERRLRVRGELVDGETLLADAEGTFLAVSLEHFLRTPEGRAARDAWHAST